MLRAAKIPEHSVHLEIRSRLRYAFEHATDAIVSVQAAVGSDQRVLRESLVTEPAVDIVQDPADERGERRFRARFSGEVEIRYEATVDNGTRALLTPDLRIRALRDLPASALQYLTPSRYCPSDLFGRFVQREFSRLEEGAQVMAALDWIHENVDYVHGVSHAQTTARETFIDRAGVCRDFTHLGITFCRALGVPARAVSAYALNLDPPDFHAVFEVFLEDAWYLADVTRLAETQGLVRIGIGRDAADIAFLSTAGPCACIDQEVSVQPLA